MFLRWGQDVGLQFIAGKAHVPLARGGGGGGDGAGLDHSCEGSALHHLEMPNLGKGELALCNNAETGLWIGEGSVAESRFIARIAGLMSGFHAPEEGFVDAMQDILQELGVEGCIFWSDLFDADKLSALLRQGDGLASYPIGVFALLQCSVVQLRAEGELLM